jgi:hypothetical protein
MNARKEKPTNIEVVMGMNVRGNAEKEKQTSPKANRTTDVMRVRRGTSVRQRVIQGGTSLSGLLCAATCQRKAI